MAEELDIPMPRMVPASGAWRTARDDGGSTTRRLVLFAGLVGGAMLVVVAGWSFLRHPHGGVPVVEADSRPLRTKPENRGGMQLAGQDDAILSGATGGQDAMAPPPETPSPQALREAVEAPAAPPVATPPAPAAAVPAVPAPASTAPAAIAPAAPPTAAASAAPVSTPLAALPASPQPATVAVPPPPHVRPAPAVKSVLGMARVATGGPMVQLAAMDSEDLARAEWARLQRKMPDLLGGRAPLIARWEGGGKVFWRLRTTGFPDIAQATQFCERMRAKGTGCSLATF